MKKSVKIAWKRFLILLICLVMVLALTLAGNKHLNDTARIVIGTCAGVSVVVYWIYAIISIRRDEQKKKRNQKDGKGN